MVFAELCPAYADFSAFLKENTYWQGVSLLPWDAAVDNRTLLAVDASSAQAGWGRPFDIRNRPSASQALATVKYYWTVVQVTIPELDVELLLFHRNRARLTKSSLILENKTFLSTA
jgi:hypothetical protein